MQGWGGMLRHGGLQLTSCQLTWPQESRELKMHLARHLSWRGPTFFLEPPSPTEYDHFKPGQVWGMCVGGRPTQEKWWGDHVQEEVGV